VVVRGNGWEAKFSLHNGITNAENVVPFLSSLASMLLSRLWHVHQSRSALFQKVLTASCRETLKTFATMKLDKAAAAESGQKTNPGLDNAFLTFHA
jgi:hypothetical protein